MIRINKAWQKILVSLLALSFCVSGFYGCSFSGSSSSSQATSNADSVSSSKDGVKTTFGLKPLSTKQTLRVGFFSGSAHSMPFYIADKEGFFKELNIDVQYVPFINGPAMMEANSSWDIADCGGPGILVGQLGHDLKMIGICDYEQNLAMFVRKDSKIYKSGKGHVAATPDLYGTADDWKGTKWLYPKGTNLQMVLDTTLNQLGLKASDIQSVNMDVTSAFTAFKGGQGDGMCVWNAIAYSAEDAGFVRVGDAGTQNVISACGLAATPDALSNKRDLIKKAWEVYYLTWQWCKSSPENMKKASDLYLESCQNEGVVSSSSICTKTLSIFKCPATISDAIAVMTQTKADYLGEYKTRPLLTAENDLLYTMDFFVSQGQYTKDNRTKLLDNKLVDPSIAEECKSDLITAGVLK